jgi:O-antigen/teichoic acid export membrane protein
MTLRQLVLVLAGSVGARLLGAALGLLTQVMVARLFPQSDVGVIFLAMSMAAIFSLIVSAGYPTLALTELPRLLYFNRQKVLRAFHGAFLRDWVYINIALAAIVAVIAYFSTIDHGIKLALVFGLLSSPVSALIRYSSAMANSLKRFSVAFLPDNVARPGFLLIYVATSVAFGIPLTVFSVLTAFVASNALAAFGQLPFIRDKGLKLADWARTRPALSKVVRARAYSLAIVAGVSTLFADIVTLLGGFLLTKEDVALLGVTIRLAAIAGFVIQSSQQYVLPDLAAALASRNEKATHGILYRLNGLTTGLILACLLGAAILGKFALGVFGKAYAEGYLLLILFMVAQSVRAFGGMNQVILSVAGKQMRTAWACLAALVLLVVSWLLLVPHLGLLGVGFAVIVAELSWALLLAWQAQSVTGQRADLFWVLLKKPS